MCVIYFVIIVMIIAVIAYSVISMTVLSEKWQWATIPYSLRKGREFKKVKVHISTFIKVYHATYMAPNVEQAHFSGYLFVMGKDKSVVLEPYLYEAPVYYIWCLFIYLKGKTVNNVDGLRELTSVLEDVKKGRDEEIKKAMKENDAIIHRLMKEAQKEKDTTNLEL